MKRERRVTTPRRAGERMLADLSEDVRLLKLSAVELDDQGRLQIGPMWLYASQNPDDSVTVYLQNAVTGGPPVTLAVLH